jgi:opacity protein-like surface antigen
MTRFVFASLLTAAAALPLATAAHAQETPTKGIYAVARAGASISTDQTFKDLTSSSAFDKKTKYKTGITGEIGGGYDFGMFRIEQTVGYNSGKLDRKDAQSDGFTANGKTRSLSMSIAGYVDLPVSRMFTPYIGGGGGVARVKADLSRTNGLGASSAYSGQDWGLMWHGDAGVGIEVAPKTTVEVGARYSQTSKLKFNGSNGVIATSYQPTLKTISGTIGVRYIF